MAMDKQKRLVDRLLAKTRSGELDWREALEPNHFRISFSDSSIILYSKSRPRELEDDYIIAMLNEEGTVVDSFTDVDLTSSLGNELSPNPSWYERMMELHSLAKRRALGSDAILNSILDELG